MFERIKIFEKFELFKKIIKIFRLNKKKLKYPELFEQIEFLKKNLNHEESLFDLIRQIKLSISNYECMDGYSVWESYKSKLHVQTAARYALNFRYPRFSNNAEHY